MAEFFLPKLLSRDSKVASITKFLLALSPGKAWRITVEEERSTRSVRQNKYLNGCVYKILSDATGYERDDISEYCCGLYWGWRDKRVPKTPRNPSGIESVPCRTTTTDENGQRDVLSWADFCDYWNFLQRHFAQIKTPIFIPDPDTDWKITEQQQEAA
ncbi:MAG TPA: hypothetical protein VHN11_04915 [Xanthobacteraceae bacterium]|nr:hypothetical protein [Xanthobacteraceae bacterium]